MINNDEKIKIYEKEFDENMLIQGNKMYFELMLIYILLLVFNYTLYYLTNNQLSQHFGFIIGLGILYLIVNILLFTISKGKLKSYRHIILFVGTINFIMDILRGYTDSGLFLYLLYILFGLVYLDYKFSLFSSAIMCGLYFSSIVLSILRGNNYSDIVRDNMFMTIAYIFVTIIVVYLSYTMRKKIISYNILKDEKTKEERDYVLATKIQDGLLPKNFETNDSFDYYAIMFPAKIVGGDFYDFYDLDDTHKVFLIADVSGKGIPASLLMASAKNIIYEKIINEINFAKAIEEANKSIIKINNEMQFITMFVGIIDLCSGEMYYINAGHCKTVIIKNNGEIDLINTKPDKILGVIKKAKYHFFHYKLNEGDKILLYTDGVIERYNENKELYGINRLINFAKENKECNSKDLLINLKKNLDEYAKNAEQNDDITCSSFELKKYSVKKESVSKEFDCKKNKIKEMYAFVESVFNTENVPDDTKTIFSVVCDEFLSNIVKYAYDENELEQYVCMDIFVNNKKVVLKIIDKGKYFNPLSFIDKTKTAKVNVKDNIGGLGIRLSYNMLDKMLYNREGAYNVLTLVKEYG